MRKTSRERLVERLEQLGLTRVEIHPTRGYWLHATQDCWRWEGHAVLDGRRVHPFSWATMRECARSLLRIDRDGPNDYDVTPLECG